MKSAAKGHFEVAKLMAPLEARMQMWDGWTALMFSAQNGHPEVTKLLIEHEAGLKLKDGRIATTMAISRYHLSCLQLLLANKAEREANQMPRVMLAAFDGDIRYLLEYQGDWGMKRDEMAVLDFALFEGQKRAVRLLAGSEEARRSFAEEFSSRFNIGDPITLAHRFLSAHASFMLDIAPAVHLMHAKCKLWLLVVALDEQQNNVSHILRAICTPDAGSMFRSIWKCCNEPQIASMLAGIKHVGFLNRGKPVDILADKQDRFVTQYLVSNPLKQAQMRRVKKETEKEAGRWIPDEKQACWREIEAESAFNRTLITESRDAILSASQSPRRIPDHNSSRIRQKQIVNGHILLSAFRFMQKVVRDMLDE